MRGKKRGILVLTAFFLLSSFVLGEVLIDEVMYDPPGTDTKHEWVEIWNSGEVSVNLSKWVLRDGGKNRKPFSLIQGNIILGKEDYALIAEDSDTFLLDNPTFNSTLFDSSFDLSNTGEELIIKDNEGTILSQLIYRPSLGAAGNGRTICLFNDFWQECPATPGYANLPGQENKPPDSGEEKKIILSVFFLGENLDKKIYSHFEYTSLFEIEIKKEYKREGNCLVKDNVTVSYNITSLFGTEQGQFTKKLGCRSHTSTGVFTPIQPGNYTLCGAIVNSTLNETSFSDPICQKFEVIETSNIPCNVTLGITTDGSLIYEEGQSLKFTPELNEESLPFLIEYWIEDLFGGVLKAKTNTTNTNEKSWKTKIDETDRVLMLKAKVYPFCQDTNLTDNDAEQMFIVVNHGEGGDSDLDSGNSTLSITKISPAEPSFGDIVKLEIEIYKGDTSKYSISAWAGKDSELLSEKTKINLGNKHTNYKLTLPIQLKPNCDLNIEEGEAEMFLEGLGLETKKKFSISGIDNKFCKTSTSSTKGIATEVKQEEEPYQVIDLLQEISAGGVLKVKIKFIGDKKEHDFKFWSYLYRGSKCYSCDGGQEREANLVQFKLGVDENKQEELPVKVDEDLESGEYLLKVKINKDGQKTNKELTESIMVKGIENKKTEEALSLLSEVSGEEALTANHLISAKPNPKKEQMMSELKGMVVYESNTERVKKLIPHLLIIVLGVLSLVLIFKRI